MANDVGYALVFAGMYDDVIRANPATLYYTASRKKAQDMQKQKSSLECSFHKETLSALRKGKGLS